MKDKVNPLVKYFHRLINTPESVWHDTGDTMRRMIDWLVEAGKLQMDEAKDLMVDVAERSKNGTIELEERVDRFVGERLRLISIPKKEELSDLRRRVNELIDQVDHLEELHQKSNSFSEGYRD